MRTVDSPVQEKLAAFCVCVAVLVCVSRPATARPAHVNKALQRHPHAASSSSSSPWVDARAGKYGLALGGHALAGTQFYTGFSVALLALVDVAPAVSLRVGGQYIHLQGGSLIGSWDSTWNVPTMLAELGIRFDQKGTYRLRLSAGFGPGYLFIRENQGLGQPKSALEASDWSHHLGIGFSTWIFDFHVQGLAHSAVARGTRASNLGTQSSEYSTSIGILFGLGLRAPIRW